MKCRYCGYEIPDGILYCERCGKEVQMVPDYNPLDDMLTAHVKDSISGEGKIKNQRTGKSTDIYNTGRNTSTFKNTGRTGTTRRTSVYNNNASRMRDEKEMRRRQAERRRELKKKKRRKVLLALFLILVFIIGATVVLYINSYTGIVKSGNKALAAKDYTKAEQYFRKAITKNDEKADAYEGLSKVYVGKDDLVAAENIFLNVLEKQPENVDVYDACFRFYLDTEQALEIPSLLNDAEDSVIEKLSEYVVSEPEFSLDDNEVYDDVQQLTLSSEEGRVLYTTNGTAPNMDSEEFQSPIQLSEGNTVIRAIVVNKKGVPSQMVEKEYMVEFPIEDAPAVSPSTGQYESDQSIEIKVPEGYTAYYTTDGNDPTISSQKYEGPIEMPKGETLFKAILVTKGGRISGVTTRNYVRE